MKEYTTISSIETVAEVVIEKSRFIASAIHVDNADQAVEYINAKRKKYFDATHNCYAYIAGDKAKFSDDGEPQGTAGLPMYECIKNNGLDYVCVVVTRYFGGVKLGAGGLVRAYSGSCAEVLKQCDKLQMTDCTRVEVAIDYSLLKPLRKAMELHAIEENVFFEDKVRLVYLFPSVLSNTITDIVTQITLGKGILTVKEQLLAHFSKV
ncbi:MAG: YigZ family protein [Clostridiales bacterium]|nr:YigZ family protein [Clostridiales bacterium]